LGGGGSITELNSQDYKAEAHAAGFLQTYSQREDQQRTNLHYEQPVEFFTTLTGGDWSVYSCNLWEDANSETESQERKLDLLAQTMKLKEGDLVLDVGCGWGGPLVYLAKRYHIRGVGLTLSPSQRQFAAARAKAHGVDVQIMECHWKDFNYQSRFDAVYTDEVIVHFHDLLSFFQKVRSLLIPNGCMVNKELHFQTSQAWRVTRGTDLVNRIYGETGNYRSLHEELALLDQAGFALEGIQQLNRYNYYKTIDCWQANMLSNRERLEELVGHEYFNRFRAYLKLARMNIARMSIDVVTGRLPG
jgi:cyclopropane-fatty-acyl-phospholipid synthase